MSSLGELLAQGDVKQISDEATRRLSKNPNDGEALVALAKVALVEGNFSRVTMLLQQAGPHADKQEVALVRGALFAKRQDWKRARETYQSLVTQEPVRPGALFGLGVCLLELAEYAPAREVLERLVAQEPPNPAFHLELGRAYLALGMARPAARQLVNCLRLDGAQDRAWFLLVNMLGSRGRQRRADTLLQIGLAQVPGSSLLRGLSNQGQAAAPSAAAPSQTPSQTPSQAPAPAPSPTRSRGLPMGRSSARTEAALPADTQSDEYHVALGKQITSLIESGQGRKALERVREAQQQGVRTLGFKLMEGWACESLVPPDVEGAIRVYEEAGTEFPQHWLPRNALGIFLLQQGKRYLKAAVQAFEAAVERAPQEAEPRFHLAQAYFQDERFAESAAVAQRLVEEVKTSDPVIHGHASRLLEQLKPKLNGKSAKSS